MSDTIKTLENNPESYRALLSAVQKARSIAAEGDYLDLLPLMSPWIGNPLTIDLLAGLASGERTVDFWAFLNICTIAEHEGVGVCLPIFGYELPDRMALLAEKAERS